MLHIAGVLTGAEIEQVRALIAGGGWVDGRATAGHLSAAVKQNRQLAEDDARGREAAAIVLAALARNGVFAAAALPAQIAPPLFNRYGPGEAYGNHIDNALRPVGQGRMRLDLSATLFLVDPRSYGGGELVIAAAGGEQGFKLAAGDLLLYDAGTIHRVAPVTQGEREACFFWVQSLVRDPRQREMLLGLDSTVQRLRAKGADAAELVSLTALYHNLLRLWLER